MEEGLSPCPTTAREPHSFRELSLPTCTCISLSEDVVCPFYVIHAFLRLNAYCWNKVITSIIGEDRRLNGISEGSSVVHPEEISKSLSLVQRSGSRAWPLNAEPSSLTREAKEALEEDFKHLLDRSAFSWEQRRKMAICDFMSKETLNLGRPDLPAVIRPGVHSYSKCLFIKTPHYCTL